MARNVRIVRAWAAKHGGLGTVSQPLDLYVCDKFWAALSAEIGPYNYKQVHYVITANGIVRIRPFSQARGLFNINASAYTAWKAKR